MSAVLPRPNRFGPYEVVTLLGAGGMGEVYRGRDPRLHRDVAIKVLARAGSDTMRQERFRREAQAASALNHPNILTVYDVGIHDGTFYLVSELVHGSSLRSVLAKGPLPVRDALDLARQIAEGLATAHQAEIVHRDLKPENVMITVDGRVKIVDFGLALVGIGAQVPGSDRHATVTAADVISGTVPYMSPEQARGGPVDYRTDQFSLGAILYEMVTGRRAFNADSAPQTLAAIIDDEPEPIDRINARVPAPVRWVIERCLAKDPRQRYDATADLARELRTLHDRLSDFTSPTELARSTTRRSRLVGAVAAMLAAALAVGVLVGLVSNEGSAGPDLSAYRLTPIATDPGYQASPAWSPDGRTLAYVAEVDGVQQVFTRSLSSSMRAQVTHAHFDCREPFWSPDGARLYYLSLARDHEGLWSISAVGGEPELVEERVTHAALSPNGKTLAFFRRIGTTEEVADDRSYGGLEQLWLATPPEASPVRYTRGPFGARRGYLDATLHFSPDSSTLAVWAEMSIQETGIGGPEFWVLPMQDGVPYVVPSASPDVPDFAAAFSWLPDNRRVVSALPVPRPGIHLWLTDTKQRMASRLITMTGDVENDPAVSPDGTRLALAFQYPDYDLYQISIDHPIPSVVLATSRNEMSPTWSPTSAEMAFTTDRAGHEEIWLRNQRGDQERPLVTRRDFGGHQTYYLDAPAFSPDGRRIAYTRQSNATSDIWISSVAGGPPVQLGGKPWQESPSWSPDGVWIAFAQSDRGTWSLMKMRVGARTPPELVASDIVPLSLVQWAPDNSWIAYNGRSGLSVASPDGHSRRVLQEETWMAFTWSADSQRVYGIRQSDDFRHLTFTSVDARTGTEHVIGPDIMPMPVSGHPVRGFTRVSPTTFLTAIGHVRSDIWLLEGFDASSSLQARLRSLVFWR